MLRTILRLPPAHLAFRLEGCDDVLYTVAVGIVVEIVGAPGVTGKALALILSFEIKGKSVYQMAICNHFSVLNNENEVVVHQFSVGLLTIMAGQ